jgi:predicted MFS family arabinose efflux permease
MTAARHRWLVFGAMSGVYFSFGIAVAAIAPMLTLVRADLGVSRGAMGFALGAWAMIYIATSPIAGRFIDRFDLGWSLALGGVSVAGSLLLRAAAQGLPSLWLAVAFFGVFGPLVSASAPKLMASWFPDEAERRRGVGWYAMAPAIGGALTVTITNPVLLVWFDSWRSVLVFEAGVAVVATLVWIVTWRLVEPPAPTSAGVDGHPADETTWRDLVASPEIRLILVAAFALFFLNHALGNWLPTVLEEFSGLSPSAAGAWVGAGGLVAIAASGTIPAFADPNRTHLYVAAVMTIAAVALIAIVVAPSASHGLLSMLTFVRGALAPLAIITVLAAERVSSANAGLANGVWFSVAEVGGVSGPLTVGALADTRVGYEGALLTIAGVSLLGAAVAVASHVERRRRLG